MGFNKEGCPGNHRSDGTGGSFPRNGAHSVRSGRNQGWWGGSNQSHPTEGYFPQSDSTYLSNNQTQDFLTSGGIWQPPTARNKAPRGHSHPYAESDHSGMFRDNQRTFLPEPPSVDSHMSSLSMTNGDHQSRHSEGGCVKGLNYSQLSTNHQPLIRNNPKDHSFPPLQYVPIREVEELPPCKTKPNSFGIGRHNNDLSSEQHAERQKKIHQNCRIRRQNEDNQRRNCIAFYEHKIPQLINQLNQLEGQNSYCQCCGESIHQWF